MLLLLESALLVNISIGQSCYIVDSRWASQSENNSFTDQQNNFYPIMISFLEIKGLSWHGWIFLHIAQLVDIIVRYVTYTSGEAPKKYLSS